jgi:DMSO/TMAO reductase YedYZ heme-binding membrane subunit/nitrite reductase/ring-hydroxylating ferredoxin subunit
MSASYSAVKWNKHKVRYDLFLALGVVLFLAIFVGLGASLFPGASAPMLLIRGTAFAAFALLTAALLIGPLARLDARLAPLLYNRRHLGVTVCLLALAHAALVTLVYHNFGNEFALVSLLNAALAFENSPTIVPFELFGIVALVVIVLMAATSHDFWLRTLSPRAWKSLHMLVYPAYALIVMHVALGYLQDERDPALFALVLACAMAVSLAHIAAGAIQIRRDALALRAQREGMIDACAATDIEPDRAMIVRDPSGIAIALFRVKPGRTADCFRALSNVCAHQGGPLGEGKVIDGCATCPWHGHQFRVDDGGAPPPYHDRVPTYHVRVDKGRVLVDLRARTSEGGAP